MVADALTKGGVDRTLIMQVMHGKLQIQHPLKTARSKQYSVPQLALWSLPSADDEQAADAADGEWECID